MKAVLSIALGFAAASPAAAAASSKSPLTAVVSLLDDLAAKVTKDGEAAAKAFHDYTEWCDDTAKEGEYAIKTATSDKSKLEAKIGECTANIEAATSKIEDLAASVATAQAELKNATTIREKEAADFASSEGELVEAIDVLTRATQVLQREMAKNPAAFAQVDSRSVSGALQAMSAVLDASGFLGSDQKKLAALVQAKASSEDDDMQPGAPAAAVYESKSGGIVEVLEDMREKAEEQLSDLRKAEVNAKHNFEMTKQSIEDQVSADEKDLEEEKATKAANEEAKATASGELTATSTELASAKEDLASVQSTCIQVAADHDASEAGRAEELKVIAQAKQILEESTSGAAERTYSFVQVASNTQIRGKDIASMVKRLAKATHSAALTQLASRIAAVARFGNGQGDDVFAKVKGLIGDMIAKLQREMEEEATEKAYCDEQMSKTSAKKSELEDDEEKLSTKIDQATAKSAELKEQIKELESQLAALAKSQAEMDKIRQETHAEYEEAKADLEQGLEGVRKALSVLRDYYANDEGAALLQQPAPPQKFEKGGAAGGSIIDILEVVESDFAKNLAKIETEESDAQADYDKISQENKLTKTAQSKDVEYKTAEAASLDKSVAELGSDRETVATELAAVNEYFAQIKDRCIAKPESYEERKARREAEIKGLKEALRVLESETALIQRKRPGLRGGVLRADA